MPEVRLEPLNQCLADGSSSAEELAAGAPSSVPEPTAASGGSDGAEGRDSAGSAALVQRFTGGGGGGGPGVPGADPTPVSSCVKAEIHALASCGLALLAFENPAAFALGVANCAVSIADVADCYEASAGIPR
jgi:hypothetical protein